MSTEERKIRNDIEDNRSQILMNADALPIDISHKDLLTRILDLQALKIQKSANISLLKQKIEMLESVQTEERMRLQTRKPESKKTLEENEQNQRANKERKNAILKELEFLNAKREEAKCEAEEDERKLKKEEEERKKQEEDRLRAAAEQEKIRQMCRFRRGR